MNSEPLDGCWCGRPPHDDLLDGCVGDRFLHAMFGPPTVESMILAAITMYGDLLAMAVVGDATRLVPFGETPESILNAVRPDTEPDIETDKAMLRLAGMDVTDADIESLRDRYWPNRSEWAA
jgi:hypothetical protein